MSPAVRRLIGAGLWASGAGAATLCLPLYLGGAAVSAWTFYFWLLARKP